MANRKTREMQQALERTLQEQGVTRYEFGRSKKHQSLTFYLGGRAHYYTFPATASDRRSRLNCEADIRRICRIGVNSPCA